MDEKIRKEVDAELHQIAHAFDVEPTEETLDELVARKRREQGIRVDEDVTPCPS